MGLPLNRKCKLFISSSLENLGHEHIPSTGLLILSLINSSTRCLTSNTISYQEPEHPTHQPQHSTDTSKQDGLHGVPTGPVAHTGSHDTSP